jgi:hypothetical protein
MSPSRRTAAMRTALAAALVIAVAGCGSSTPSVSPAGTAVPSPTAAATVAVVAATPTPTTPAPTEPTPPAAPSAVTSPSPSTSPAPVVDPVVAASALSSLGSYRVSTAGRTAQGPFTAEMVVVQRPTPARSATITTGSSKIRIVTIGPKAWIDRTGKGRLAPGAFGLIDGTLGAFEPSTLVSLFGGTAWLRVGPEVKNGVPATHYHADGTTGTGPGGATFPPGASIDLWVSAEGRLVAFEANDFPGEAGASDLRIEVTRQDDPANRVTKPA